MISQKEKLRVFYKNIRTGLSDSRRKEAEEMACSILLSKTKHHTNILSFAPLPLEINLSNLNKRLSREKNLYLPKVINNQLEFFLVKDLEKELSKNTPFSIWEPIITKCPSLKNLDIITFAIIPGLAFDKINTRLGYGKGFYDKFLAKMENCYTLGIGFKEQYYEGLLPKEQNDIPMDEILLT
jgi:5-formyltetrahydrofolate cyclo-ligase